MKSYKMIKNTTKSVLVLSLLCLFFQLAIILPASRITKPETSETHAQDFTCDPTVSPAIMDAEVGGQSNVISVKISPIATDTYTYNINISGPGGASVTKSISTRDVTTENFPSSGGPGVYEVKVTAELPFPHCVKNPWTESVTIENMVARKITLKAEPSTIDLSNEAMKTTDIQYSFSGHRGESFHLWITDCAGNYQDKKTGTIDNDIDPPPPATHYSEPWTPEETTCASHQVRVKTFDSGGNMTDSSEITVNVNGASGGTGGEVTPPSTDPGDQGQITTPDDVSVMGSMFTMPKNIRGLGDIIEMVLKVLEYIIGVLAFISIVMSGIKYITSGGDSAKAEKAKKTLIYSVIGIVLAVFSLIITSIIGNIASGPR